MDAFLREHGISRADVARAVGLSGPAISRKVLGSREWNGSQIDAVLAYFSDRLGRPVTYEEAFAEDPAPLDPGEAGDTSLAIVADGCGDVE